MDPLELVYDDMNSVPEAFRSLYQESGDGKAVLTQVNGLKTQDDIDRLQGALDKERKDHKAVRTTLSAWGDMDPQEVQTQLDRIPELEAAAEGKMDDDKINQIVESRINQKTKPLERSVAEKDQAIKERDDRITALETQIQSRDRNDIVRAVSNEMKAHSTAQPDIEMAAQFMLEKDDSGKWVTKDGIHGVTPGLDVKGWLKEMQRQRPHWWPESAGGGAGGGGGIGSGSGNPWSHDGWNMTEQSRVYREQGPEIADRMAKAAGTKVGGTRPPKK